MKTIHLVCAARPNFMKVAPLYHALKKTDWCKPVVVWGFQHTDDRMSGAFLVEFDVPNEDLIRFTVGSGTHAEQTGAAMVAFEPICIDEQPDAIVVVGDVNVTMACALVGAKLHIPVVHLEAGLRSHDREMPEEINRVVTDAVSSLLLTPSLDAVSNLRGEGIHGGCVKNVGNIMIDALEMMRPQIEAVKPRVGPYAVVTLHRPSNVDDPERLKELVDSVCLLSNVMRVRWPVHPRTYDRLYKYNERQWLESSRISLSPPKNYVEFLALLKGATIVITDSGGVQEETTYLGVPCATVRESTERPVTISHGTNVLITPGQMTLAAENALAGKWPKGGPIPLWDGHTSGRVVDVLKEFLGV